MGVFGKDPSVNTNPELLWNQEKVNPNAPQKTFAWDISPLMRLPVLDAFGHIASYQYDDSVCAKIELRWYECAEAYGQYRAHKLCANLFDDMKECRTHEKAVTIHNLQQFIFLHANGSIFV